MHAYSPALEEKRELVLLNKCDLIGDDVVKIEKELKKHGIEIFMSISAATKGHTEELTKKLLPLILEERKNREVLAREVAEKEASELPVLKPQQHSIKMGAYRIERRVDGSIVVVGQRLEQFTKMTNFDAVGGLQRFRDVTERVGLTKALKQFRKDDSEDTPVYIGMIRVDEYI